MGHPASGRSLSWLSVVRQKRIVQESRQKPLASERGSHCACRRRPSARRAPSRGGPGGEDQFAWSSPCPRGGPCTARRPRPRRSSPRQEGPGGGGSPLRGRLLWGRHVKRLTLSARPDLAPAAARGGGYGGGKDDDDEDEGLADISACENLLESYFAQVRSRAQRSCRGRRPPACWLVSVARRCTLMGSDMFGCGVCVS